MIRELGHQPHGLPQGHYLNGQALRNPADLTRYHDDEANRLGREYRAAMLAKHPRGKLMGGTR